jgi:hypothetical protein
MTMEYEAFAYRVQSRFGSIVRISIQEGKVTITGPRIAPGLYRIWLGSQAVLLVLAIISLVMTLIFWNWVYLVTGLLLFALHGIVGGVGAGCLWELERLIEFGEERTPKTVSFHVSEVKNVRIGIGWARGAIRWIIAPYIPGINQMAKGMAVSFEAPDGVLSGSTVYALHMRSIEDADHLAMVLRAGK